MSYIILGALYFITTAAGVRIGWLLGATRRDQLDAIKAKSDRAVISLNAFRRGLEAGRKLERGESLEAVTPPRAVGFQLCPNCDQYPHHCQCSTVTAT